MRALQEYRRPRSPEEAISLKRDYGARALYLAGGSDILVHKPSEVEAVIDIRHAGMDDIQSSQDGLLIGGAALLRDVESWSAIGGGLLRSAVRETAPWLIRNAATLAGNIANASPAADSVPALIALDAELILQSDVEERVPLLEILQGPHRTSLGDRLIRSIRISPNAAERRGAFIKLSRSKSDIAQVNVAVSALIEDGRPRDVRIALGAVSPTAMRAYRAEQLLEGADVTDDLLIRVVESVKDEVRPISDWRASEDYRRRMSGVLVKRALAAIGIGTKGGDSHGY